MLCIIFLSTFYLPKTDVDLKITIESKFNNEDNDLPKTDVDLKITIESKFNNEDNGNDV
jgi:hypothetical protein